METDSQHPPSLELAEVVASALRTHPALAGAEAQRDAAGAELAEARSARLPTVSASALAVRYQEPMVVAPLHGFDLRNPPQFDDLLYQGHATAEYTLFDGGARGARIRGSAALAESAALGVAAARDAVLAEVTSAYLSALTARDVLRAHDQRVRALEEERARARLFFEEGTAPRVAVLRTEAALSRAEAARSAADEALGLARRRLARASGLEPARVEAASLRDVALPDTTVPSAPVLVARALSANPALARAAGRVAAAEARASAARATFLPRVSLTGRYSAFGASGTDATGEWQAGLKLSYPLFSGGAR
ncbi:MAG: TolC family protein, partial [Gemmatimonadota bacterium]